MKSYTKQLIIFAIAFSFLAFLGCEKKTESAESSQETNVESEPAPVVETPEEVAEPEEPIVQIPDLKGQWTGTFDSRPTVLNITEQTDSTFSGKITINYRTAINQDVAGNISPATMKLSMTDQLHSRFKGKYLGNLSKDGKTFAGTFTMDLDGTKYSFNLNKK